MASDLSPHCLLCLLFVTTCVVQGLLSYPSGRPKAVPLLHLFFPCLCVGDFMSGV